MTDTPRSLADIQTLFANNTAGAISAQDLRDFVQSVARPLEGEGFFGSSYPRSISWAYAGAAVTLPAHPTTYGTTVVAPFGVNRPGGSESVKGRTLLDPDYSIAGTDPNTTYDVDIDAGNAFMLDPGVWFCDGLVAFAGLTGEPPAWAYIDQATYDSGFSGATDGSAPWWYDGWYNPTFFITAYPYRNVATGSYLAVHSLNIVVNDTDEPQPFALFMYTNPGRTTDLITTQYGASFCKLS